jgi:hypothetical protein
LAREPDHSDRPGILPSPELNPLLNPLLGQHMGRWAEVYFTSPPEKREEAVLELLRQLEANPDRAEDQPNLTVCYSCGRENPSQQNFCGMCGAPLRNEASVADPRLEEQPEPEPAEPAQIRPSRVSPIDYSLMPSLSPRESSPSYESLAPGLAFRRIVDAISSFGSSRFFLGGALAIVTLLLVYMAWRSSQVVSGISRTAPAAAVRQPAPGAPQQTGNRTETSSASSASDHSTPEQSTADHATAGRPSAEQPVAHSPDVAKPVNYEARPGRVTPAQIPATSPAASIQTQVVMGPGAEELATARTYLNGTGGQHNGALAAGWLWKAVGKQNAEASLLLSDLYLRGDGVSKNCDQARVLLDAAARKGIKDAAERLRQLPASGCE